MCAFHRSLRQLLTERRKHRLRSRNCVHRLVLVIAFLLMGGLIAEAQAQSLDLNSDITTDYNQSLSMSGQRAWLSQSYGVSPPSHKFALPAYTAPPLPADSGYLFFVVDAPLSWNSNPSLVPNDARSSMRFDPKLQLNAAWQMPKLQLSLQSTGDLDRYSSNSGADTNGLQSLIKLAYKAPAANGAGLPKSCDLPELPTVAPAALGTQVIPYAMYQSTLKYAPQFGSPIVNQNDVGAGMSFASTFFGVLAPQRYADSQGAAHTCPASDGRRAPFPYSQVGLDVQITRRFSVIGANSESIYFRPSWTLNFSDILAASIQPSFRVRWFDEFDSQTRRDITLLVPAAIAWDPDIGGPINSLFHPEVRLSMNFARNWSTVPSKEASQWDVGPLLELIFVPG